MKEIKVGLFTVLALACLAYMATMVSADNAMFGRFVTYKALVSDAEGLFKKSLVRVAGIEGGFIEDIQLSGDRALVTFKIQKRLKITSDSKIKIKSIGFLGDRYIDIFLGDPALDRLPKDSLISVDEGGGLDKVTESAGNSLKNLEGIMNKMKEAIENDETDNALRDIVKDMRMTMGALAKITAGNQMAIGKIVKNLEVATSGMGQQFDPRNPNSIISKMGELTEIIANFKDVSASAKEIMAAINAGEGTVGKFLKDKDTEEQITDTISNVNKLVNRINSIEADLSIYSGYNTDNGSYSEFGMDLYPTPERFYRLGVTVSDFGPQSKTETQTKTISGGVTTVVDKEEIDKNALKINAQIGRNFHNFGIRAGLIETTGGAGIDYNIKPLGMKVSADVFDFGGANGANLRVSSDVRLWNVVYGKASLEDSLNDSRSLTVSGGLKFSDEDLASFIGLFAR